MFKNTAGQKWVVFAFQGEGGANPGQPVTGDAANITANLRLDGGAANAVDDVNPTELEDGYYVFDITQAESNADLILICPASGTANVNVIGVPGAVYTTTNVSGVEAKIDTIDGIVDLIVADTGELQTDWVNGGRLDNILDALQSGNDAIEADTQDIQSRLPAALVSGRMDASIGAAAADTINASALAADAVAEIVAGMAAWVVDSQGSLTFKQAVQGIFHTLNGQTTVSGGTYTIKTPDGVATRITFTLDANKQRTAVSLNLVG